ncbi:N-methyl-L-tryptophan oxidase [Verrucomicrobiales bacterium]|jgi:sarcosine oxidase|nr:N-methyl-L-tryptophan oxidase [Verrucomicrobiales bacterium]MDC0502894.1 N-methyl-L-tryptophan oxidase [Verrucomicrobiales bacterium]
MGSNQVDVIVVGVGTMGAAAAYHLAKRGASVLGLEQHAIPHALGAHHGFSRAIRSAYYEHPNYVPLLQRAFALWEDLEKTSGLKIIHRTGGVYMGAEDAVFITGATRAANEHGLSHELLSHSDLGGRFPQFSLPSHYAGFLEKDAGFVVPETAMSAHLEGALAAGARLLGHVQVKGWDSTSTGVTVHTSQGRFTAKHLILTAGAWSPSLLGSLPITLTVTRQTWGWFWPNSTAPFSYGTLPTWFVESEPGYGYYGFPMMPDNPGLKIAYHKPGEPVTPSTVRREVCRESDEPPLRHCLEHYLSQRDGDLLALRTCLYTNSPDGHFVIDAYPDKANVTMACGFSGHGFKFAPVIGEMLAEFALDGRSNLPVEFLRMSRFL